MDDVTKQSNWRVYVIRCGDDTFYTGISTDVERRLRQHQQGKGARYTRGRDPLVLWWTSDVFSQEQALVVERQMKQWTHAKKEALRNGPRGHDPVG